MQQLDPTPLDAQSPYALPAPEAARALLGAEIINDYEGITLRGRIIETEAYDALDPASHSFRGLTNSNAAMFGPIGHFYIYLSYGIHVCCNVVVGTQGSGAAVLIRAVEPLSGMAEMSGRRHAPVGANLTNGPGKLCQAMAITREYNGQSVGRGNLQIRLNSPLPLHTITSTRRIGISKNADALWRFYETDNPYVSKR